jgi:DNA-binding transcriptional LysR family regulator
MVDAPIADGTLIDLFPDHDVMATDFGTAVWLLYPSRSYLPSKVRVFIDFLRQSVARRTAPTETDLE